MVLGKSKESEKSRLSPPGWMWMPGHSHVQLTPLGSIRWLLWGVQYEPEIEHEVKFSQIQASIFPTHAMIVHSVKSWTV